MTQVLVTHDESEFQRHAASIVLPLVLLRRVPGDAGEVAGLLNDPRLEVLQTDQLTPAWIALAQRAAGLFIHSVRDPLTDLVYAVSAGIRTPIIVGVSPGLRRTAPEVEHGGARACFTLPLDSAAIERLVAVLLPAAPSASVHRPLRLLMDPISRTVTYSGRQVLLSPREFALLHALSRRSGPVSVTDAYTYVWGGSGSAAHAQKVVAVYVFQLRKKLQRIGLGGAIRTVRGYGYHIAERVSA